MIVIQPYDKGSMQAIEKAIQMSDLGLPPNNDGKVIRLNIPPLTQVFMIIFICYGGQNSIMPLLLFVYSFSLQKKNFSNVAVFSENNKHFAT